MKRAMMYYKLLSVAFNLCPRGRLKDKVKEYALKRFPEVK